MSQFRSNMDPFEELRRLGLRSERGRSPLQDVMRRMEEEHQSIFQRRRHDFGFEPSIPPIPLSFFRPRSLSSESLFTRPTRIPIFGEDDSPPHARSLNDSEMDRDLEEALKRSLEESSITKSANILSIEEEVDPEQQQRDEDEEFRRALELSKLEDERRQNEVHRRSPTVEYITEDFEFTDANMNDADEYLDFDHLQDFKERVDLTKENYSFNPMYEEETPLGQIRKLKKEQDQAYEASLKEDQIKEWMQKQQEESQEEQEAIQMSIELTKMKKIQDLEKSLPSEPAVGLQNVTHIVIRMPDGKRLERRFLMDSKLQLLRNFIDSKTLSERVPDSYEIVTDFPKKIYSNMNSSFRESGLYPRALVSLQES